MAGYLPLADEPLATWTASFMGHIVPDAVDYGLTPAQAAAYATKQQAYQAALAAALDPATRGAATIFTKNEVKKELIALTRETAMQIQGTMSVTDEQRQTLGLTVRKTPTPIPPPSVSPDIDVVSVVGRLVTLRLHNAAVPARRKPDGALGATLFSFVGPVPSQNVNDWKFEGSTTNATTVAEFDESVQPGTKVWFTAFWYNRRGESGPPCDPVGAVIQFGGMSMAA